MSQFSPRRLATAAGLALGTAGLAVAVAPTALAAPAVTVSSTTVAPGAEFTISGTGCVSADRYYDAVAVFLPAIDPQWADTEQPGTDGSWTMTRTAPTELGSHTYSVYCDWYAGDFDYADVTITVTPDGKPVPVPPTGAIRGPAAVTPGVASPDTGAATGDRIALGRTVVKILTGFKPGEVVTVTLHSTPQRVGTFTADASGTVRVEFTVPAGTPVGDHTLVYEGDQGTYFQEAFAVAATAAAAELPNTGSSVAVPLGLGLGALAVGGGLVLAARRSPGAQQV